MATNDGSLRLEQFSVRTTGRKQLALAEAVTFAPGRLHVLIGPNGSGKTSLLRGMAGILLSDGVFLHDEQPLALANHVSRAKRIAYQPQSVPVGDGMSALEFVMASSGARSHWLGGQSDEEVARAEIALRATHAEALGPQLLSSLSGGEMCRVMLAATLAMGSPWMLLDEPVAAADVSAARSLYALLRGLVAGGSVSVVVVEHDLGLARTFADDISLMHQGKIVLTAPVEQAFASPLLEQAYGCRFASYQASPGAWAVVPADPLPEILPVDLNPPATAPAVIGPVRDSRESGFGLPGVTPTGAGG